MPVYSIFRSDQEDIDTSIMAWVNQNNQLYIQISERDGSDYGIPACVVLDKRTAIKFAKELRKEISFMEEDVE